MLMTLILAINSCISGILPDRPASHFKLLLFKSWFICNGHDFLWYVCVCVLAINTDFLRRNYTTLARKRVAWIVFKYCIWTYTSEPDTNGLDLIIVYSIGLALLNLRTGLNKKWYVSPLLILFMLFCLQIKVKVVSDGKLRTYFFTMLWNSHTCVKPFVMI